MGKKKLISNEGGLEIGAGAPTLDIPITDIYVDEARNQRHFPASKAEIEELARSIMASGGLIQPVVVRPHVNGTATDTAPGPYPYELLLGFQRVAAIEYANEMLGANLTVLARVLSANDEQAAFLNLDENLRRKNLSVLDVAYLIKGEREKGVQFKDISKKFGKTGSWASQMIKYTEFRPTVQKKVHDGTLSPTYARALVGLTDAQQDDMLEKLAKGAIKSTAAATADRKTKKKRSKRGRKASTVPSAKAAVAVVEELTATTKQGEDDKKPVKLKLNAKQVKRVKIMTAVLKYLQGKLKPEALGKAIEKLV